MKEYKFNGSGTKIFVSDLRITHSMPSITVEAEDYDTAEILARFKFHDLGYQKVHAMYPVYIKEIKNNDNDNQKDSVDQ